MNAKSSRRRRKQELLDTIDKLNYILEPFYRINYDKLRDLQKIVHQLEKEANIIYDSERHIKYSNISGYSLIDTQKNELIGVLPKLLFSKEIFDTNKELIYFSNSILNIDLDINSKRPRQYLVGTIIDGFMAKIYDDNYDVMTKINNYIDNRARSVLNSQEFFKEWDKIIGDIKNG